MHFLSIAGGTDAAAGLIANTGIVAKIVLLILLLFSLLSWAIILGKAREFRVRRRQTRRFLRVLYKSQRLSEVHSASENYKPSPAVEVFEAGYEELDRQMGPTGSRNLAIVERVLRAETADQVRRMEDRMNWLATTASACPFIGLFGTVWGIMNAFHELGNAGVATLRAVGPGISEALVTTAAGLFVAIPALIAYNLFLHRVRELTVLTDELALEFANRAEEMVKTQPGAPAR